MSEAPTPRTDIDAPTAAKLAYHASSASVIASEIGNPKLAALSREVMFETIDLVYGRESVIDPGVPDKALPTG